MAAKRRFCSEYVSVRIVKKAIFFVLIEGICCHPRAPVFAMKEMGSAAIQHDRIIV